MRWTLPELWALRPEIYTVLVEEMNRLAEKP